MKLVVILLVCGAVTLVAGVALFSPRVAVCLAGVLLIGGAVAALPVGESRSSS